jgi:ubiquinone/menaquinone biosynthesis C-methylase UbiE
MSTSRRINWVSSIDKSNRSKLAELEKRLTEFYATHQNYYQDIDFTSGNWTELSETGYQEILSHARLAKKICEVGCGRANILKHNRELISVYSGCDFSDGLMRRNASDFPGAKFGVIQQPNQIPFPDNTFDFVFLVFVLEHSTNPALLLDECTRILVPGGKLMLLCPDFLGTGRMTSQRAGFSEGTASQKLRAGKIIDAFVTLFDNRVRIPLACRNYARIAIQRPLFLINLNPVVFDDSFTPDVDAVYVSFRDEICHYLRGAFDMRPNGSNLQAYEKSKQLLFLSFVKQ